MNPDLVFGDVIAVGDVKYKVAAGADWPRSDLNQIVAFAAAARTSRGVVVGFQQATAAPPPDLQVGEFTISYLSWPADDEIDPASAAKRLAGAVAERISGDLMFPRAA